jgi:hypothetical protein
MLVVARGDHPTPGKVTRQMVHDGLIEPHRENAQRNGAVKDALDRVETIGWSAGGPFWERTTVESLLRDSSSLEPSASPALAIAAGGQFNPLQLAA